MTMLVIYISHLWLDQSGRCRQSIAAGFVETDSGSVPGRKIPGCGRSAFMMAGCQTVRGLLLKVWSLPAFDKAVLCIRTVY